MLAGGVNEEPLLGLEDVVTGDNMVDRPLFVVRIVSYAFTQ